MLVVKEWSSEYSLGEAAEYFVLAAALLGGAVLVAAPEAIDFLAERRLGIQTGTPALLGIRREPAQHCFLVRFSLCISVLVYALQYIFSGR